MKQTKRFLALLLAFSMCLSMITPAYASEIEEEPVVNEPAEVIDLDEEIIDDEEVIDDEEIVEDEEIISNEEIASEEAANEVDLDAPTELNANVDFDEFTCEVKIAANTEKSFVLSSATGMELLSDGKSVGIVDTDPYQFAIKNDAAEEKTVILKLQHPVGSVENPEILYGLGENTATMFSEKYYYSYTAVDSCVLEFTGNEGTVFSICNQNDENWNSDNGVLSVQVTAGDVLSIAVAGSDPKITWNFNYAVGSALNPIPVEFTWNSAGTEAYAEITIPANTTNVYSGGISGMVLFVDGVMGQILTSESILDPVYFTLTNETQEAKAVSLHLEWPVGSRDNPEVLMNFTESQNKLEFTVEEGNSDGYFFTYITEADGEYIFYKENSFDGDILISVDGEQYSLLQDGDDVSEELSVSVVAGKTMTIQFVPGSEVSSTIVGVVIAEFTHPYGSYENPVQLEWYWSGDGVNALADVEVPEGETWYVQVLAGMELWIDDEDFLGIMRPDDNGNCVIALTGGGHYLNAWWPMGTKQNPEYIWAGDWQSEFIAIFDEYTQDYYFVLYPEYYGTLMFNLEQFTGDTWSFTAENENSKEKIFASDMNQDGFNNGQMYVKKGDKVLITVSNSGPETEQILVLEQKLDTKYIAKFDQTVTSGKTLTLNFIHPETGKKISASKVNWQISSISYYSPYNFAGEDMSEEESSVDEQYYSAYATLSNGKLKTLKNADSVFLFINATLKENPDYRNEFYVEMLPAATLLNVDRITDVYEDYFLTSQIMETQVLDLKGLTSADDPYMMFIAGSWPNNANQTFTWKSSSTKIARIVEDTIMMNDWPVPIVKIYPVWDAKGNFKAGTATITATATDGSGKKFSFKVEMASLPTYLKITNDYDTLEDFGYTQWDPETNQEVPVLSRVINVTAGQKIKINAEIDTNVSKGKNALMWGVDFETAGTKISKGTVTVSKNAFDGELICVKVWNQYVDMDCIYLRVTSKKEAPAVEEVVIPELQIVTKNGQNMGVNDNRPCIIATAGQKIKLKVVDGGKDYTNIKSWDSYGKYITVNKKGEVTIKKDVPSDGVTDMVAVISKDGFWTDIEVVITPLATNIHTRIDFGEGMKYVTNSTQTLDLKNLEPDANGVKKVELSALVYPFEASQNITWSLDGAGKKVARIEKTKDATYLIFNGKSGKMTVTATANDGSKQKASFKLNLPASIIEELYLEAPYFQTAGKTVKLASYLTINPTKPAAKDLRWAMQVSSVDTETWMPKYFSDVPSGIATLDQKGNLKIGKNLTAPIMLDIYVQDRISGNASSTTMLVMPKAMTGVVVRDLNGNEIKKGTTVKVDDSAFAFTLDAKNSGDFTLADYYWMAAFSGSVDKEELAAIGVWNDENPCVFQTGDAGKVKVTIKAEDGSKKSTYFYIQFENTAPEIC